jgi:hypothetical protein
MARSNAQPELDTMPEAPQALLPWQEPAIRAVPADRFAAWPIDLREDAFASPLGLPWLSESCLPVASQQAASKIAIGTAVRLLRLPPALEAMPRPVRRRLGRMVGELFEVFAHTLPGQLAIARRIRQRGEDGLQVLYVSADCVERAFEDGGEA